MWLSSLCLNFTQQKIRGKKKLFKQSVAIILQKIKVSSYNIKMFTQIILYIHRYQKKKTIPEVLLCT